MYRQRAGTRPYTLRAMRRPDPAEIFTELAPLWRDPPTRAERLSRRIVRHLRAGGAVLDVGCGTGAVLGSVRSQARWQGKRIGRTFGVDVSEGMTARARWRSGVRPVVGDAMTLPFVDQYFDVVTATDVMQYVSDPERVARELFRVTLPGGTIIIELAAPIRVVGLRRSDVRELPRWSLLRRYVEMRRTYAISEVEGVLSALGCTVRVIESRAPREGQNGYFLARLGRASASREDLAAAHRLAKMDGHAVAVSAPLLLVARVPGPRRGGMRITVKDLPRWTPERIQRLLDDLPVARGYSLEVKPLRWRTRPHVQAFCEFNNRKIIIQVPVPFFPFSEDVPYRARRIRRGRRWHFRWYWRRLRFERPHELIRFLYLHEYYHWYLREVRGKRSGAETACDRFALQRLGARVLNGNRQFRTTASRRSG